VLTNAVVTGTPPTRNHTMIPPPATADRPLTEPLSGPRAWQAADLQESDWRHPIDAACRVEIAAIVSRLRSGPIATKSLRPDAFDMDHCRALMARVKHGLESGCGFALIDRLPMAEMTKDEATAVYWLLSSLICRPVAQKLDGTLVYDVHDTGKKALPGSGVRPDKTNIDLTFHNDNSYNDPMPDFVGLLCLRPAKRGGVSRVMSFETAHNALLSRHRDVLARLYEPFIFDRQREHAPNEPETIFAPVFENKGGLRARLGIHQVRNGYEMTGSAMNTETRRAIAALEDVFADSSLQFQFAMTAGQFQYVNNKVIGHSRTEFEDFEDPDARRHLVRLWMRSQGDLAYSG